MGAFFGSWPRTSSTPGSSACSSAFLAAALMALCTRSGRSTSARTRSSAASRSTSSLRPHRLPVHRHLRAGGDADRHPEHPERPPRVPPGCPVPGRHLREPQPDDLDRPAPRPALVARPLPDPARTAAPGRRRAPAGGRHGRDRRLPVRYGAVDRSPGMLAALGGAYLSIGFVHSFNENMTAVPRVHRARRGDLRELAPVRRGGGLPALRLLERAGAAAPRVLRARRRRSSRRCRTS